MASGAPKPGGYSAIPPGGFRPIRPGGMDLNERAARYHLRGFPDFQIDPGDLSGARVAQTRTAANVRKGRAPGAESYAWSLPTRPGGSTATVTNGTLATASFTPDVAGTYVFQCAVTFSDATVITKSVIYISA